MLKRAIKLKKFGNQVKSRIFVNGSQDEACGKPNDQIAIKDLPISLCNILNSLIF